MGINDGGQVETGFNLKNSLALPLFDSDGKLLSGNLRSRIGYEFAKYFEDEESRELSRGQLSIERNETDFLLSLQPNIMSCVEKIQGEKDGVPNNTEWESLAVFLSWSFTRATGRDIRDNEFIPQAGPEGDMRKLFGKIYKKLETDKHFEKKRH